MGKYLWLLLTLVLVMAMTMPLTALFAKNGPPENPPQNNGQGDQDPEYIVYLHNIGTIPEEGGKWHFVINGLIDPDETGCAPILHIFWNTQDGNIEEDTVEYTATNIHNKQASFLVPYTLGWTPNITLPGNGQPDQRTFADIPCGAKNPILTASLPTAPVPEATPSVLLGLGLAGLGAFILIKRKNLKSGLA